MKGKKETRGQRETGEREKEEVKGTEMNVDRKGE